jgi:hypothetical protein
MAGRARKADERPELDDGYRYGLKALRRIDWNGVAAFQVGDEIPPENLLLDGLVEGEDYEQAPFPDAPVPSRLSVDQGDDAPGLVDPDTGERIAHDEHPANQGDAVVDPDAVN